MQEQGYFDMHTHIIPGYDDGSVDMDMSMEMVKIAYQQGIRHICATPHCNNRIPKVTQQLEKKYEELMMCIQEEYPDMTMRLGNENMYCLGLVDKLKKKEALTLAGTRYVLVEFQCSERYTVIYKAIRELVDAMYIPIIAHVERYVELRNEDRIKNIISVGAYLQMNSKSVLGGVFNKNAKYCRNLIKKRYIHLLGSDCHNTTSRSPIMEDAIKKLRSVVDDDTLDWILYINPKKVFADKYI